MDKSRVYSRLLAFCVGGVVFFVVLCISCLVLENKSIAVPLGVVSGYGAITFFGVALIGRSFCKRWKLLNWVLKNSSCKPEHKVLTWSEDDLETYFEGLSLTEQQGWLSRLQAVESRKLTVKQKQNLELIKKILNS